MYPKLNIDGQMFPTWVMANFKEYQLSPIISIDGEDPCKPKTTEKTKL